MLYLSEISLIACWVAMAAWQAHLIRQNRPILHGVWSLLSAFLIAGGVMWVDGELGNLRGIILYVIAQGCARLVVFNVSLNLFRGLSWQYDSPVSGSLMDKFEIWAFGSRLWIMELMIGLLFLTLQFFI